MSHQDRKQTPAGQQMIAKIKTRDDAQLVDMFRLVDKGFKATKEEHIVWDFLFDEMQERGIVTYDYDTEDFYLYGESL